MKLSEQQVQLKKAFRFNLLHLWSAPNAKAADAAYRAQYECGFQTLVETVAMLDTIPSCKKVSNHIPLQAWLAQHFPKTSDCMFAKRGIEQCLTVWSKEKYTCTTTATRKWSRQDQKDVRAKTIDKQRQAVVTLIRDMPVYEKWHRSAWKTVK